MFLDNCLTGLVNVACVFTPVMHTSFVVLVSASLTVRTSTSPFNDNNDDNNIISGAQSLESYIHPPH